MGLVRWIVLAAAPGFATVVNGTLTIFSIAVPEGRPVIQLCGLCSDNVLTFDLYVETAWPVLFLLDLRTVQVGSLCILRSRLEGMCHLSPDTL